ncbi:PapD-like protein [Backusella circina FSU 941]|nr:PapD-like protein [Backusella circina FSU 941]
MSVELDIDNVIEFERPLTRIVKKTVTITNPNSEPLAFKVKTTAPKLYCVRPNSEIIQPHQSLEVQIILQALKKEPEPGFRCKDKFLILSILVDEKLEGLGLTDLWTRVEGQMKSSVSEKKLRCNFIEPVGAAAVPVAAPPTAAASAATVPAAAAPITQKVDTSIDRSEEMANEKLKQMQAELEKYKTEAKTLRDTNSSTSTTTVVKQPGTPYSIYILFALMALTLAYLYGPSITNA